MLQPVFDAMVLPEPSARLRTGLERTPVTPNWVRAGPEARIRTCFVVPGGPLMTKPGIRTFWPVPTGARLETFTSLLLAVRRAAELVVVPVELLTATE